MFASKVSIPRDANRRTNVRQWFSLINQKRK